MILSDRAINKGLRTKKKDKPLSDLLIKTFISFCGLIIAHKSNSKRTKCQSFVTKIYTNLKL